MTYIEQRAQPFFSFGSRSYGQDLFNVKTEDCVIVGFAEAVFPQSIAINGLYKFGDVIILRVWGQTWDDKWILLWETSPDGEMLTFKKCSPPIRQIQKLMRLFRIDFKHSLLKYHVCFDAVVLTGYKPKFLKQEYLHDTRSRVRMFIERKYDSVRWYLNEFWLARSLHSHNYEQEPLRLRLPKIRKRQHHFNKDSKPFPTLPNEIMLQIFNYLDIKSLHRCAQVNKKWLLLSQDASLYYELNLKRYWHKVNNAVLQHFMQICRSLQKLDFSWCGRDGLITEIFFIEFLQTCCQNLTHLSLGYCSFVESSTLEEIGKCNNLTDLRLTYCAAEHYFPLTQLTRLTILVLDCSSIADEELIAILSVNPNLEHLILDYCRKLWRIDDLIETIAVYNSKLITWSYWGCHENNFISSVGIRHLAKCPDLRELDIGCCFCIDDPVCLEYIALGCKNFKRLALPYFTSKTELTEYHLLPIIRSCDKLIWLDIRFVEKISKDFCEMILALLPDLKLLELCFGIMFEEEQIAAWKNQYPNVVVAVMQCEIQFLQFGPRHISMPRCRRPNYKENHPNVPYFEYYDYIESNARLF